MATGFKVNEVTVGMLARILSIVQMRIAHATCMGLVVESQPFVVIVNKAGRALTVLCSHVPLVKTGLGAPPVETTMHT